MTSPFCSFLVAEPIQFPIQSYRSSRRHRFVLFLLPSRNNLPYRVVDHRDVTVLFFSCWRADTISHTELSIIALSLSISAINSSQKMIDQVKEAGKKFNKMTEDNEKHLLLVQIYIQNIVFSTMFLS